MGKKSSSDKSGKSKKSAGKASKGSKSSKSKGTKSTISLAPQIPPLVTPPPKGVDPSTLVFPEWSDAHVNQEKWDTGKKGSKKGTPVHTPKDASSVSKDTAATTTEPELYEDPHIRAMPFSISVSEWKRAQDVFPNATLVVYQATGQYPDLLTDSKHILHSTFMRHFIASVGILEYLGNTQPFVMEETGSQFAPNTEREPWKPWHHIYSMCKAGKSAKHNPQVNKLGKYVLRLFWMGSWKIVMVDDWLPIDQRKNVLLPSVHISQASGDKNQEVRELWPYLLAKGLLKLASLSWTKNEEIVDFNVMHCLTGWMVQEVDVKGLDWLEIWNLCVAYCDHFEWPPLGARKNKSSVKIKKKKSKSSTKTSSSKSSKSKHKGKSGFFGDDSALRPFHLVAQCQDLRTVSQEAIPDIAPCWDHSFLIDQTRCIPMVRPLPKPELARWKIYRWVDWAIRKGLWEPDEDYNLIKCIKMVSTFKQCADHIVYGPPSKESLAIKQSVKMFEKAAMKLKDKKKKGEKGKKKDKKSQSASAKKSSKTDSSKGSKKGSSKGSKKGSKKGGKKGAASMDSPPDPSFWGDFFKIGPFVDKIFIYFKLSQFEIKTKITDVGVAAAQEGGKKAEKKSKKDKTKSTSSTIVWDSTMHENRNEPLYLFTDSLEAKFLVFGLNMEGDSKRTFCTCDPCECHKTLNQSAVKALTESINSDDIEFYGSTTNLISEETVPFAYVIFEYYNWKTEQVGDKTVYLNTKGHKSLLFHLGEGRFVFRLWIKSDTCFALNICSDTEFHVGTLETILFYMTVESVRCLDWAFDVMQNLGTLVKDFGFGDFAIDLFNYRQSYKPKNNVLTKSELCTVHETFYVELTKFVAEHAQLETMQSALFALKVLFREGGFSSEAKRLPKNLDLAHSCLKKKHCKCTCWEDNVLLTYRRETGAVRIQAIMKGHFVRHLSRLHDVNHKNYMKIFDALKKLYYLLFAVNKRVIYGPLLIRQYLSNPKMNGIKCQYPVWHDLQSVLNVQHFEGTQKVSAASVSSGSTWVPIARYVFYVNSMDAITLKICLFTNKLDKWLVRVINNDSQEEITRFTNNVTTAKYANNVNGYTVLGYGFIAADSNVTEFDWKLIFATLREKRESCVSVPASETAASTFQGYYVPNVYDRIFRCLVKIKQHTLATFRMYVNYENVNVRLVCTNVNGDVLQEISGRQRLILPAAMLEYCQTEQQMRSEENSVSKSKSSNVSKRSVSKSKSGRLSGSLNSGSTRRRSLSSRASLASDNTFKEYYMVYVLEAYVLDKTWPLLPEEWTTVGRLIEMDLVRNDKELLANSMFNLDSITESSISSGMRKPKRSSSTNQKSLVNIKKQQESSFAVSAKWQVDILCEKGDFMDMCEDLTRKNEIKAMKMKWYENNINRYTKSFNLRNDFLKNNYLIWKSPHISLAQALSSSTVIVKDSTNGAEFMQSEKVTAESSLKSGNSFETNQEKTALTISLEQSHLRFATLLANEHDNQLHTNRTQRKIFSVTKMLPTFDESIYYRFADQTNSVEICSDANSLNTLTEFGKVRTEEDELESAAERQRAIDEFQEYRNSFLEHSQTIMRKLYNEHETFRQWFAGCDEESAELMKDAQDAKENYLKQLRRAEERRIAKEKASEPPPSKDKKSKKKKK